MKPAVTFSRTRGHCSLCEAGKRRNVRVVMIRSESRVVDSLRAEKPKVLRRIPFVLGLCMACVAFVAEVGLTGQSMTLKEAR